MKKISTSGQSYTGLRLTLRQTQMFFLVLETQTDQSRDMHSALMPHLLGMCGAELSASGQKCKKIERTGQRFVHLLF